jgi:hypothetical protein
MIRFLLRFLATIALAVSVIMAVLDATRTIAAGDWVMTPLGASWLAVSPTTLESAQKAVESWLHPVLWDPLALFVLKSPGFIVFAVVAFLLYALGRTPRRRLSPFAHQA